MTTDRVMLLDEHTANRIAAGEVVERPASAVKELVENALDAGATRIKLQLEEGGRSLIRIEDNGCGMSRNDAILALQRHATSKIRSADDLFALTTLGFRGEALPSIASVSHLSLFTRSREDDTGIHLTIHSGEIDSILDTAMPCGTVIHVEDLFYNTPARMKFLKSTAAELGRSVDIIGQLAIAHPDVSFQVMHRGQEALGTPGNGDALAPLAAVWGRETAKKLIPIEHDGDNIEVRGFIATPEITRPGRSHELFYVNGRPIKSRVASHALEDAFRALTPESRYPVAAIFIKLPADQVDVNVHPTKTEVKFIRDGEVHHAVSQAVKTALLKYGIVPTVHASVPELGIVSPAAHSPLPFWSGSSGRHTVTDVNGWNRLGIEHLPSDSAAQPLQAEDPVTLPNEPRPFAELLREYEVLGQLQDTYIIARTPRGLAVIDQHVAHERVLYERLTVSRSRNGMASQLLNPAVTITLERREALLLGEHTHSFKASGWEIEKFGGDSFVVRAIPASLSGKPYEQMLRDMIDELVNQSVTRRLLVQQDHVLITNACKMAVKAGDPLTIGEMTELLQQLAETENPYLCPHGRPIVVTIGLNDLEKLFKRA